MANVFLINPNKYNSSYQRLCRLTLEALGLDEYFEQKLNSNCRFEKGNWNIKGKFLNTREDFLNPKGDDRNELLFQEPHLPLNFRW